MPPPPQPRTNRPSSPGQREASPSAGSSSFTFSRAYPFLATFLVGSARMTQPLLLLSLAVNVFLTKRLKTNSATTNLRLKLLVWYLAYFSFYSRHTLALLSLGWLMSGRDRRMERAEEEAAAAATAAVRERERDGQPPT